jgi:TetR/AcrR family transcriptional repressor of nem operon
MTRVVKDYEERRQEILDTAQRLIYTRGYEQMTIQDILDEIHISKGTFYYYFDSKQSLLEALLDSIVDTVMQLILPVTQNPNLSALEKLNRYISISAKWKTERKDYLLSLLRVWYQDENAIVRQKMHFKGYQLVAPLLTEIVLQGVREGKMVCPYPEQAGEVAFSLMEALGDRVAEIILSSQPQDDDFPLLEKSVAAYSQAIEHVFGIPKGSLQIYDLALLRQWVKPVDNS